MNNQCTAPLIYILMSTYNGSQFLVEQLESIESQTFQNWRLILSDDGSGDNSLYIANKFQQQWGKDRLEIRKGPQKGFCQNFLSMACDSSIRADYYAFSDQDDVWMADKLARAVEYFNSFTDQDTPRVYCSRTEIVDEKLKPLGLSPLFTLPTSFRNALVQNIAGGNTMVFNQATKELLEKAGLQNVVSHDWWLYQITKAAGGIVYYDPKPTLLYRQHANSIVGANSSLRARVVRLKFILDGRFKSWLTKNYLALIYTQNLMSIENKEILDTFGKFRNASLKDRIRLLGVCGLYRQTWQGTLSLWFATMINKI